MRLHVVLAIKYCECHKSRIMQHTLLTFTSEYLRGKLLMLIDLFFGHSKYAATTTGRNKQNTNQSSIYAATKRAASVAQR